jgi:hypothetical protein
MDKNTSNNNSPNKDLTNKMDKLNLQSDSQSDKKIINITSQNTLPLTQINSFLEAPSNSDPFQDSFSNQSNFIFQQQQPIFQQQIFNNSEFPSIMQPSNFSFQNSNMSTYPNTFCEGLQINNFLQKINQGEDTTLPVVSVIVTLYSGSSYDDLFRSIKQVAPEGRVALYCANLESTDLLLKAINGELNQITEENFKSTAQELLKDIESVEPDCVLFNWECCSSCAVSFPQSEMTMKLLKLIIDKHYMVMFSDFALKSLIRDWDTNLLGLNPFKQIGVCSSFINLKFKPNVLKECPSSQLKMVGQLCEKGEASLHALSSTIVFTVDNSKIDASRYQLQILTIVTETNGCEIAKKDNLHEIDDKKGTVGHAMIKFNNGGVMIVSAGHWIELSKLDVNVVHLEKAAEMLGGNYSQQVMDIKNSKEAECVKAQKYSQLANQFVMQSAPCNYSQKVQNYSKK